MKKINVKTLEAITTLFPNMFNPCMAYTVSNIGISVVITLGIPAEISDRVQSILVDYPAITMEYGRYGKSNVLYHASISFSVKWQDNMPDVMQAHYISNLSLLQSIVTKAKIKYLNTKLQSQLMHVRTRE